MTDELQEIGESQKSAIFIWRLMSVGPIAFVVSLVATGVALFALDRWVDPKIAASENAMTAVFALISVAQLTVIGAEVVATAMAYSRRAGFAGTPFESHATSVIRTFWLSVLGVVASYCAALPLLVAIPNINAIGFGVSLMAIFAVTVPATFIWQSVHIRRGLRRAKQGKPIADNPTRWS